MLLKSMGKVLLTREDAYLRTYSNGKAGATGCYCEPWFTWKMIDKMPWKKLL